MDPDHDDTPPNEKVSHQAKEASLGDTMARDILANDAFPFLVSEIKTSSRILTHLFSSSHV